MIFERDILNFINPNTLTGSLVWALIFLLSAVRASIGIRRWSGRLARQAKQFHLDITAIRFGAQLMQLASFLLAAIFYAHLVPALRSVGTALLA